MKVGLIDADIMWTDRANGRRYGNTKADVFPNLALMKLSADHKKKAAEEQCKELLDKVEGKYNAAALEFQETRSQYAEGKMCAYDYATALIQETIKNSR